jgi:hypothetical protein
MTIQKEAAAARARKANRLEYPALKRAVREQ